MPILTPTELLDWLSEFQFLSLQQIAELRPELAQFPDNHSFAKELIRRDWLTPYQVNQILKGNHEQLVLGSYRLRERIGEGAMGQVFKAWQPDLGRVVAIKMIHKNLVNNAKAMERFRREVEAAGQLDHPNIASVRDAGEIDGRPYLVMDFIDGFNLSQRVKQLGALPIHEAVEFAWQAALGLQHAFEKNIVHRDIKPGNLQVTTVNSNGDAKPLVKILDFGLARFESEEEDSERLTEVGKLLGTIDYVAPEQAHNARGADIRADIYSLGCTLFYLLAGRPAFLGDNILEKLTPRMTAEPPWIRTARPEVPPGLEEVLRKMMARQPEDRYQTPLEVANALGPFTAPIALAMPTAMPATGPVVMAMPVPPDAVTSNVPMALPIATSPPFEPDEPSFLEMTASGLDLSSGPAAARPAKPQAKKRPLPLKLLIGVVGSVVLISLLSCACLAGLFYFKDTPVKKNGTLRITKAKWSTGDELLIPGQHHHVLVWIERVDFRGPVKIWVKDLPPGVQSDTLNLVANIDNGQVKVTVSHGTQPVTKAVKVYAECDEAGAWAEMPMTLVVKEDPWKLKK